MISSPSNLRRVQTGDDLGDVLGELERKYVRGKEWEMKEESYLGAGDGWEEDERQRQAQQYQKPPPPQGLQGANDGPFPNNVSYSKAHARAAAAAASSSPVRVQTAGKPSSPDDAYDAQLSHYDSAVRAYKANVGEGLGEMEGRAEFVERWREDEERKKEERERMLMQAKREASRSPKKSPRRNTKVGYDDVTLKLILSTFYAYHKPEKIGMVGGIVDGWKGDKMEILKTLQDKYEVGEEVREGQRAGVERQLVLDLAGVQLRQHYRPLYSRKEPSPRRFAPRLCLTSLSPSHRRLGTPLSRVAGYRMLTPRTRRRECSHKTIL